MFKKIENILKSHVVDNYLKIVEKIKDHQRTLHVKTDSQLKEESNALMNLAQKIDNFDSLIVRAFALVAEAIERVMHINPYDEQLIGGLVLFDKKIAEMNTGEGKTLTAIFPAYLHGLKKKGVHILTFNDYLAERDANWMGSIFTFLGLTVGFIKEGYSIEKRKNAYKADVTYITAREAGFDYLRDCLVYNEEDIVQRPFYYAIVDEADSILIDEARVPLIVASVTGYMPDDLIDISKAVKKLQPEIHIKFDSYGEQVHLTDEGLNEIERLLNIKGIYESSNVTILSKIHSALFAEYSVARDIDYIVRDQQIEMIDEFTGRVAKKRRWPDSMQTAIEVKENIPVKSHGKILQRMPLHNFIFLYEILCGMTATAMESKDEFSELYNLKIVTIPPHKKSIRVDKSDNIFKTTDEKQKAIVEEILKVNQTGQPILVGTKNIKESIMLYNALKQKGINCSILNAKNDKKEAEIISNAGRQGSVVISTNMAGRGIDIILGGNDSYKAFDVKKLGGLYVLATNRFDSNRIDKQLIGRSGRQGDPGVSRFFISLEDDLFCKYKLADILPKSLMQVDLNNNKSTHIHTIALNLQKVVSGSHYKSRQRAYRYYTLINEQRKVVLHMRSGAFDSKSNNLFYNNGFPNDVNNVITQIGHDGYSSLCRDISLKCIDDLWSEYLYEVNEYQSSIHLRRLGGEDPIFEFQKFIVTHFSALEEKINRLKKETFKNIVEQGLHLCENGAIEKPTATYTYIADSDPFEDDFGNLLTGYIGINAIAGLYWPLTMLNLIIKRLFNRKR